MGLGGAAVVLLLSLAACAPREPVDDLSLSTKVKIELIADRELGAMRIDASTLNGVVTLSGAVPSQAAADRAVAAAKRVPGVRDVKSELKIAG
jgi:hyperosmotically inducible protein